MSPFDPPTPQRPPGARREVLGASTRVIAVVVALITGFALAAFGPVRSSGNDQVKPQTTERKNDGAPRTGDRPADGTRQPGTGAPGGGTPTQPTPPAGDGTAPPPTGSDPSTPGGTTPTPAPGTPPGGAIGTPSDPQAAPDAATADTEQVDALALDQTLRTIVAPDINAFWAREFGAVYGTPYTPPVALGGYAPGVDAFTCGDDPTNAAIPDNAFYCPSDGYIAYDRAYMAREAQKAGPMAPVFILAHEWGHLVQNGLQVTGLETSREIEMNADCLAGAYARDLAQRANLTRDDIDDAVDVLVDAVPDDSAGSPDDHGGKLDRISAFNEGFTGGATACVTP